MMAPSSTSSSSSSAAAATAPSAFSASFSSFPSSASAEWSGRLLRCSYKRATFVLCTGNIVVAFFMLHATLAPLYLLSSSPPPATTISVVREPEVTYTKEEQERIDASNKLRRELLPVDLIARVKEIQAEAEAEANRTEILNQARQRVASELAQRLRELKISNSESGRQALEEWKKKKLEEMKSRSIIDETIDKELSSLQPPIDDITMAENNGGRLSTDKLSTVDMEHEVIPGRHIPAECHAEAHTDYDGLAVRWGLTHHVASAADCCQACLDQAKNANDGEKKCNIWVYCAEENGCYSPDKYQHKNHECWLKQADEPQINFKGQYDEEYRHQHPTAPVIVPWISGVTAS